jgi:hypothetical protein
MSSALRQRNMLTERHTDLPRLEHLLTGEQVLGAFYV